MVNKVKFFFGGKNIKRQKKSDFKELKKNDPKN
jgi:hypothetical protein